MSKEVYQKSYFLQKPLKLVNESSEPIVAGRFIIDPFKSMGEAGNAAVF
jgi:hypothetical protein